MKKRIGSILGLLLCAAMAFGQGQAIERDSATLTNTSPQPAGTKSTVQIDNRLGTGIVSIAYNFGGTIGTSSIVLKGCMRPGTAGLCDTLETNTATTDSKRTVTGLYDWYTVTPTFTGGASPVVNVNWTMIPGGVASGNAIYTGASTGNTTQISAFNNASVLPFICAGSGAQCGFWAQGTVGDQVSMTNTVATGYNPGNGSATTGGIKAVVAYQNGAALDDFGFWCGKTAKLNALGAATTQIVAGVASQKIRVCSFHIENNSATATNVKLVEGTGANCGTGTTDLTGLYALSANTLAANFRDNNMGATGAFITNTAADALCVTGSAAGSVEVTMTYEQH